MGDNMKKIIVILIVLISLFTNFALAIEEGTKDMQVRIYLKRLDINKHLELQSKGNYIIYSADTKISLKRNMLAKIDIINNKLRLQINGVNISLADKIEIKKQDFKNINDGIIINNSKNLYPGNFIISILDNRIFTIFISDLEQYLYGVVPYEMSNSFPIEALKAQAIAARSYAIKNLKPNKDYDLYDTTKDQVYKGYDNSNSNAIKAVDETKGIIGYYNKDIASFYYSGSNGGQTSLPENRWGNIDKYNYYKIFNDEYDLKNTSSPIRQLVLNKNTETKLSFPAKKLLINKLDKFLQEANFEKNANLIRIDAIKSIALKNPKYNNGERIYKNVELVLRFSGKRLLNKNMQKPVSPMPTPYILKFLDEVDESRYSDFEEYKHDVRIEFDNYSEFVKNFGLALKGGGEEIISIDEDKNTFIVQARRFGHGIGMSQRGAEQMAKEGKTYREILKYYFPKMELNLQPYSNVLASVEDDFINLYTEIKQEEKTPKAERKLIPLLWDVPKQFKIAVVNNIDENSYLNLRSEASKSSSVVMKLYYGQEIVVIKDIDDKWAYVAINGEDIYTGFEGYVDKEFISIK